MKAMVAGWSIMIPGSWNPAIITHKWLRSESLTDSEDASIEVAINSAVPLQRFSFDGVTVGVEAGRLALRPHDPTVANLNRCREIAAGILRKLSHTPIDGVGINFGFERPKEDCPLLNSLQNFPDAQSFAQHEYVVHRAQLKRTVAIPGDETMIMNLGQQVKGDLIVVDFNFHTPAASTKEASEKIPEIEAVYDVALKFLERVYDESLTEDEE